MPVTNNFVSSSLDLNGKVTLTLPTALVWGPDGRLYVTEVDGDVRVLSVAFGDKNPADTDPTAQFYVTAATSLNLIKAIQNHNDDGSLNSSSNRQITGIDVTQQFDANGQPMLFNGKPAVTMYVTSSDSRIGAGTGGGDSNLDTNSGVVTKLVQTGPNSWDAVDIIRGLPRSEENHAPNGLEVVQEVDADGNLVSERMILASGGNANAGAPSNNFAGQQEQPLSAAILEINLDALRSMPVLTDANGRKYVYDLPTLNDPVRGGNPDANDPFGGRDGLNSAKLLNDGIISIYSPGHRNAYDVEVTEDGRVWSYDNGANNSWGGRPIGEAGDTGTTDHAQDPDYIATNLNNGDGNTGDDINLVNWNPSNKDNFHEVTRSDDLAGRTVSAGQGGAQTYVGPDGLTYVYGGHPNPTRAEGAVAGLLFTPSTGTDDAFLLVSSLDSYADAVNETDYQQVIGWLAEVEANDTAFPGTGAPFGATSGSLTRKVIAVTPGVAYDIYKFADGSGAAVPKGGPAPAGGTLLGTGGLPADIAEIVAYRNKIEGNYKEAGKTDGALDTGTGSINGLAEYTSTVFDDGTTKMSGAIIATDYNGDLIIMGRNANGTMSSTVQNGFAIAADRTTLSTNGTPLGIDAIGDDYLDQFLPQPFQGSVWVAGYQNQPFIRIYQPNNGAVPLAGVDHANETDNDLDGLDHVTDPFEYSAENGYALAAGNQLVLDFSQLNPNFPDTLGATGLLGAALDGTTPNRDAQTVTENYTGDQVRDGLFNNGENLILGANADFVQIKNVVAGTVVGGANTARDVLQTGIRPAADVARLVIDVDMKNWVPVEGGVEPGQLTGLIYGDGTQSNFIRFVFGSVNGQPGFEIGYEIGDANYQVIGTLAEPDLMNIDIATLELRLEIDKSAGYAVHAFYRLEGEADFTEIALNGFTLPSGVLRDVLNGAHTVGTGAAAKVSGAAVGLLAETAPGASLASIDFDELRIRAFADANAPVLVGISDAPNVVESGDTGSTMLVFPLTASNAFSGTVTVTYNVAGGASGATANVTFTAGQGTLQVAVPNDDVANGPESVAVTLTAVSGTGGGTFAVDGAHASGDGLVTEDDATGGGAGQVVYRWNAGTSTVAATDGGLAWVADAGAVVGAAKIASNAIAASGTLATSGTFAVPGTTPKAVFAQEYYGSSKTSPMGLEFGDGTLAVGSYAVRLYMGDGYANTAGAGKRVFDVLVENNLFLNDLDLSQTPGHMIGGMWEWEGQVTDGTLDIDFAHVVENPLINAVEIIRLDGTTPTNAAPVISTSGTLSAPENQTAVVTVAATDANNDPITYSITAGADAAKFAINAQTGALSFVSAPNFEAPGDADGNNVYQVEVGASDGKTTTKKTLSVGVTDVAEGTGRFVFRLIDADTDAVLDADLSNGAAPLTSADLAGLLTIEALPTAPITGSIALKLVGPSGTFTATESYAPYAVFGDSGGNFAGKVLQAGQYTFSATHGGQTESVTFTLGTGGSTPPAPKVSVLDATVGEGAGSVALTFKTDTAVPAGQTVTVNFQIAAGTATPAVDYQASGLTFANGVYSGSVQIAGGATQATKAVSILQDTLVEGNETFSVNVTSVSGAGATVADGSATVTITDDDAPQAGAGAATLVVTPTGNIQTSTYGSNSFTLTNTGDKVITKVVIDITDALYPDMVFDPFGLAGDTVSKGLTINTQIGATGVVAPSSSSYIGTGGTAGYEAIQLVFNPSSNGGFQSGEAVGFSIDNDPNSVAGAAKTPLDAGSSPSWDVGGVSGAELIGSTFTVEFSDGTSATGKLGGMGNQSGAHGIASQSSPNKSVVLTVNGVAAGGADKYGDAGPTVLIQGQAGETARVVLTKGFIQPVTNQFPDTADPNEYHDQLDAQLAALAASDFPANNAVEFQTVDIVLTGGQQNISGMFDFDNVAAYNFAGEDKLPLGFAASVIDPDDDLPLGAVTSPIHLVYDDLA